MPSLYQIEDGLAQQGAQLELDKLLKAMVGKKHQAISGHGGSTFAHFFDDHAIGLVRLAGAIDLGFAVLSDYRCIDITTGNRL